MDNMSYNIRVPKRWTRLAAIVGVLALIAAPMTALATHSFDDVPNSHTFHGDIAWMKASGVTKGCNPPANSLYCPEDDVTRGQMSAFMRRFAQYLGAEDGTPAQADNASTADSATTAGDADTLDGKDGTAYETRVAADGCRLNVAASATSCGPNSNGTLPNGSTFEFAAATVNGPSSGTLVVSAHTWSSVIHWLTLDQSCDSGALFAQALNGLIWIEDTVSQFSIGRSANTAINVPSGSHTVRLCGASGTGDFILNGQVTASWTAGGNVSIADSSASSGGATLDQVEDLLGR